MLTVMLVAVLASAALWQQWRAMEVEGAERARMQAAWVLIGALDWSRLILREDARANAGGGADHLAEPWAVPLAEARLSSFLAADKNLSSDALEGLPDAFLSGQIVDAQSRLNALNLIEGGKPAEAPVAAFHKLFRLLGLPAGEVETLVGNLQRALPPAASTAPSANDGPDGPLLPWRAHQLVWLGLSPSTVAALAPYVTILPARTPLNLNTASAEAIYASVPELDLASARRLVERRAQSHFRGLADANALAREGSAQFIEGRHGIGSRYFEVHGRLRLDNVWVEERTLIDRDGLNVRIVWRERGAGATILPPRD
jgi:general secretion pathway protein K